MQTTVFVCLFAAMVGVEADDWPCFLGPGHNGISPETGLLREWTKETLPVIRRREVGESFTAPSVAGDDLILFHRVGNEEVVECLDPPMEKVKWSFAYSTEYRDKYGYNGGPRATPIITEDRVYTLGAEGKLHALERTTGKRVWSRWLNKEFNIEQNFFGVGGSPLLEGDLLLINVGGQKGAGVAAFNRHTGKTVWLATDDEASYATPICATIHGERLALFFTRSGLVVTDAATGKVHSTHFFRSKTYESVNAATPIVIGDLVFLSASYRTGACLLRIRPQGHDLVWSTMVMENHWATSILLDGYVYGPSGRHENDCTLRCVKLESGELMWEKEGLGRFSMIYADGRFILLSERGELILARFSPEGYEEISRIENLGLKYPCYTAPVLSNGLLYVRDETQVLGLDVRKK